MKNLSLLGLLIAGAASVTAQQYCWNSEGFAVSFLDKCESHFFAEVEYLAWYVDQEGMSYATSVDVENVSNISNEVTANSSKGKDLFFKNRWDSGVRGIVGFKPHFRSWDIRAGYTYFATHNSPKEHISTAIATSDPNIIDGTAIVPSYFGVLLPFGQSVSTYSIKPHWNFDFNQLDVEFNNEFYTTCDTTLRIFGGFRGLKTTQKFDQEIFIFSNISSMIEQTSTASFYEKSEFTAFGTRAGFDVNYNLFEGFDLYANFAGAILWGWFHNHQSFHALDLSGSPGPLRDASRDELFNHSHHTAILNIDTGLGIRWNTWLNCHRHLLTLRFGWEQHLYTNVNQLQSFISPPILQAGNGSSTSVKQQTISPIDHNIQRGDLSLSGFVFGLAFVY